MFPAKPIGVSSILGCNALTHIHTARIRAGSVIRLIAVLAVSSFGLHSFLANQVPGQGWPACRTETQHFCSGADARALKVRTCLEQHWANLSPRCREQLERVRSQALAATPRARTESFPLFRWKKSLPVDFMSPAINPIGGTEARALVTMGGKLYAGIGYWEDSESDNPQLPGGQVLRLDASDAQWKIDFELDDRVRSGPNVGKRKYYAVSTLASIEFRVDANRRPFEHPAAMLFASTLERGSGSEIFYRESGASEWVRHSLAPAGESGTTQVRSFALHQDKITGIETLCAGASPLGIFAGVYDPQVSGKMRWGAHPEPWATTKTGTDAPGPKDRVMSFAECNGRLYSTVYNKVYERQDGPSPTWKKVYEHPYNRPRFSGFRGATTITDPKTHHQVLLLALENRPLQIFEFDPSQPAKAVEELNVSDLLQRSLKAEVRYGIAAYNNMLSYPNPWILRAHF